MDEELMSRAERIRKKQKHRPGREPDCAECGDTGLVEARATLQGQVVFRPCICKRAPRVPKPTLPSGVPTPYRDGD